MPLLRCLCSLGLILQCSQSASPQQATLSLPQRDSLALSLLTQCNAAMGATGTVPDLYLEGVITPANPNNALSTFILKSKGTDQLRSEINSPAGKQVFVVSHERGFSLVAGVRKNLAVHLTSYFRPEHLSAFACSIDVARPDMGVSYAGLEELGTSSVHHLIFLVASADLLDVLISEFHVYIDAKTFRVVKTVTWAFAPDSVDNRSKWETYYDAYQPVNGILMPAHVTHFLAGTKFDEWNFTSIRTDVPFAEGDFQ